MDDNGTVRPVRDRAELQHVISVVLDHLDPDGSAPRYRVVGTGAALAQGVELPTGDVDILVERRDDVDRFAATLSRLGFPCLAAPVWIPESRQYFTNFAVDGIGVGASTVEVPTDTDTFECIGPGPWRHRVDIDFGRHVVPVVRLELRLVSELVRGRPDRYLPLIDHLRAHGADLDLVRRAMRDRRVDPALRQRVIAHLHVPGG